MSLGLRELTSQELSAALESVLLPRLFKVLAARDLGHCMRVTDLDRELMIRLAGGAACGRSFCQCGCASGRRPACPSTGVGRDEYQAR